MRKFMLAQNRGHYDAMKTKYDAARALHTDAQRVKAIVDAQNDPVKMQTLAAAREFNIYLNLMSNSNALENFEYSPLKRGDWAQFTNYYNKKVNISILHPSGGNMNDYISDPSTTSNYQTERISTDWIYVTAMNQLADKLKHSENINNMISEAMTIKVDTLARTAEDAGFGSLTAGVEYVQNDSRVSNLPTSNDISATSEGAITINLLKTILQHFVNLNKRVRKIEFNPAHASEIWDWSSVTSGVTGINVADSKNTITEKLHEEIYKTGTVSDIFGYKIQFVPVDTIPQKYVRVYTEEPVGYFFDQPDLATSDFFNEKEISLLKSRDGMEAYRESRYTLFAQAAPQKLNYARFHFAT